jgi:UDPglucose--hexose-1-phosphate uridylyltransferase
MQRLCSILGPEFPFMTCWQQAPATRQPDHEFAVHLQIMPMWSAPGRFKFRVANETAVGLWSNEVLPEAAAELLRAYG